MARLRTSRVNPPPAPSIDFTAGEGSGRTKHLRHTRGVGRRQTDKQTDRWTSLRRQLRLNDVIESVKQMKLEYDQLPVAQTTQHTSPWQQNREKNTRNLTLGSATRATRPADDDVTRHVTGCCCCCRLSR